MRNSAKGVKCGWKRRTKKRLIGGLIGVTAAVAAVAVAVFAMPSDGLLEEIAALMTKSTAGSRRSDHRAFLGADAGEREQAPTGLEIVTVPPRWC